MAEAWPTGEIEGNLEDALEKLRDALDAVISYDDPEDVLESFLIIKNAYALFKNLSRSLLIRYAKEEFPDEFTDSLRSLRVEWSRNANAEMKELLNAAVKLNISLTSNLTLSDSIVQPSFTSTPNTSRDRILEGSRLTLSERHLRNKGARSRSSRET